MSMNYYELLGISPVDKNLSAEEVLRRIQKLESQFSRMSTDAAGTLAPEEAEKRKALLDEKDKLLLFASGFTREKPLTARLPEDPAAAKKLIRAQETEYQDKQADLLKQVADMMYSEDQKTILRTRLQKLANEFGVELGAVIKIFKDAGFEVITGTPQEADSFTSDADMAKIDKHLNSLKDQLAKQKSSGIIPTHPIPDGISGTSDLFGYLAEMTGKDAGALKNPRTSTQQLHTLADDLMKQHTDNYEPVKTFRELDGTAAVIFSNDTSRRAYETTLRLKSLQDSLLSLVRKLPPSVKADRSFAEMIIQKIRTVFSDEDLAIAIYNKYCNVPRDLHYEKESSDVSIMCKCGHLNIFPNLAKAKPSACGNCGLKLFIECPNCGESVANSIDTCICGYYLPGKQLFFNFKTAAQNAVDQEDLARAEEQLQNARKYKPKKESLAALEASVERLRTVFGDGLRKVSDAIDKGDAALARKLLTNLKKTHPKADFSKCDDGIRKLENTKRENLTWAANEMARIEGLSDVNQKVITCLAILAKLPDYKPALEMLNSPALKPAKPLKVNAAPDYRQGGVVVSWLGSPQNTAVTYTVVRKEGKAAPFSIQNGVKVAEGLTETSFLDKRGLKNGAYYTYSVFSVRGNNVSLATAASAVVLIPGISAVPTYTLEGENVHLGWEDPSGSAGARVELFDGTHGKWVVATASAAGSFQMKLPLTDQIYQFRLSSIWVCENETLLSGQVQEVKVKMTKRPLPIDMTARKLNQIGLFEFRWSTDGNSGAVLYDTQKPVPYNTDVSFSSIVGTQLKSCRVSDKSIQIDIGTNNRTTLQVFSVYGSDHLIAGNYVNVDSMLPLTPDWEGIEVSERELSLNVNVPAGYTKLCVLIVEHKSGQMIHEKDVIDKGVAYPVNSRTVKVTSSSCPIGEIDVYLVAQTAKGILSPMETESFDNTPKGKLSYRFEWKNSFGKKSMKITVKRQDDNGKDKEAKLCLCYQNAGQSTLGLAYRPGEMTIVSEIVLKSGQSSAVFNVKEEDLKSAGVTIDTGLKLFLKPTARSGFCQPQTEDAKTLRCPWHL